MRSPWLIHTQQRARQLLHVCISQFSQANVYDRDPQAWHSSASRDLNIFSSPPSTSLYLMILKLVSLSYSVFNYFQTEMRVSCAVIAATLSYSALMSC